jgi:hypothetical protein
MPGHTKRLTGGLAGCSAITYKALRRLFNQVPELRRHELVPALLEFAEDLRARNVTGIGAGEALRVFCDQAVCRYQ